ncbi:hypothetical protein ASPWEDRAFT_112368 [Aspergillus wentii DTO 134E9]|uniref:SGNH hydrolase-type esterase domain-containing protein n=1 Tax=Aspergillus wentii DTO 134E9 TaxID=1073089 RepID=A0A1L9RL44_ASPWE|nr:uncharacterized protein ASPWEDRAFT_112368 [Aspergillus wentii DTO 134E9]OJJ35603.1 hypothetical protein ASPWEDRAFT_112368 [Aspergillus wentii DTO 134E9]
MVAATPVRRADTNTTYFFTFGDSYSQTGFYPEGEKPTASNPMGNPELGTGTTTNGPNWVGYLTTAENASLVLSYNLAQGGATIDNSIVSSYADDLVAQVETFQENYSSKPESAPWTGKDAVFGFWFGINDVGNAYSSTDADTLTPKLITRYLSLVEKIYNDGGRKFLFINVPPTGRTPMFLDQGDEAVKQLGAYVETFNKNLEAKVKEFNANHTDTTTVVYDSWSFMTKILDSPSEYGFPNATCINDDGSSCVWWNNYHPGFKYHKLQAEDMKPKLASLGW